MPWAAGSYTKGNSGTGGWVGDASLGIGIEAGRHDTQDNDFATGINQCLNKDGSNAATGNLNLGGFKYTNAAAATLRTDLPQVAQVQDGDFIWLGTTGGSATAQTASATPAITAYKDGQKFRMKPGFSSTGTTFTSHTLSVNGLVAKAIIHQDGNSPTLGSWLTGIGRTLELVYNDGFFVVVSAPQYYQSWTPTLTPAAGSASSVVFSVAKFTRLGNSISFNFIVTWTQNTASASYIDVTLPVRPANTQLGFGGYIVPSATTVAGWSFITSIAGSGTLRCYAYDTQQILTGAGKQMAFSGTYEVG